MNQELKKSWWLLVLCGVLDVIISLIYLTTQGANGAHTFHAWRHTVVLLGNLTLAAGICSIAVGVWNLRKSESWLLVLNGIACSALGAALAFWTGPLAFRTVALLIAVMAISIGIYEFISMRVFGGLAAKWLLGAAGMTSIAFAAGFLAYVFGWMRLQPGAPAQSLHWLGFYFAFSAICMLLLTLRLHRPVLSPPGL